ncbi:hypothetical protein M0R04_07785 [Candidatus Dojkabacteria bacterium]|jgi:hypothetical protein|nr:hypothetical protein [Candidatus Dojkabacteria bacterium]
MNEFIYTVKQENKDREELDKLLKEKQISEEAYQIKLEQHIYKNRYALYLSLNPPQ